MNDPQPNDPYRPEYPFRATSEGGNIGRLYWCNTCTIAQGPWIIDDTDVENTHWTFGVAYYEDFGSTVFLSTFRAAWRWIAFGRT
jgi:hypothetical protein